VGGAFIALPGDRHEEASRVDQLYQDPHGQGKAGFLPDGDSRTVNGL
jgi:hypothetical protein